jgi:uncharacterized protein (UPF0128 family)
MEEIKEKEEINNIISQLIVSLREERKILSIADFAQILGGIFDDIELKSLIREIKNVGINI